MIPWITLAVLALLAVALVAARQHVMRGAFFGYVGLALGVVVGIEVLVRLDVIGSERAGGLMGFATILLVLGALFVLRPLLERPQHG
jgi:hypothetical protein